MFEKLQERLDVEFQEGKGLRQAQREQHQGLPKGSAGCPARGRMRIDKVAKDFLEKVQELALGEEVMQGITPGQQVREDCL